jgi:hypothetical protein
MYYEIIEKGVILSHYWGNLAFFRAFLLVSWPSFGEIDYWRLSMGGFALQS